MCVFIDSHVPQALKNYSEVDKPQSQRISSRYIRLRFLHVLSLPPTNCGPLLSVSHKSGAIYTGKKLHRLTSKSQNKRSDLNIIRNYDSSQAFIEHGPTLGKLGKLIYATPCRIKAPHYCKG